MVSHRLLFDQKSGSMTKKKELFIVEGKSAESTLQQATSDSDHSILAIQGKLINVAKAMSAKVYANTECSNIFQTLACGVGEDCKPELLNYSRIVILTDPDIDGSHTRALVLSLFDQYLRPLVDAGLVSIIIPPLYRIIGQEKGQVHYAWNEQERVLQIDHSAITRFKGIAQFSLEECDHLFLNPQTRRQITLS